MLLRRKRKIDAPWNFYPEPSLHVTAKTMQHPTLSTRLIPVSWQQMYSNPAVKLMPVTHSSLCPCPAWTVPSQTPNEAKGNAFHESEPTRFTPCDFGILVSPRSPHDLFAQLLGALLQLQVPWKLILVKKLLCLRSFLLSKAATTQALISTEISRFCSLTSPVETLRRHPQVQVSLGYQWRTYLGMNINSTS